MIKNMKEKIESISSETLNNNSTFNRIQEIQVLIKKEAGLKELCMFIILIIKYIIIFIK